MRLSSAVAAAVAVSSSLAPVARSATLITSPAFVATTHHVACQIANAGTKTVRALVIEVLRYNPAPPGTIEVTSPVGDLVPLAYASDGLTNASGNGVYVCRFVFKGSAKGLRGSALVRDGGGNIVDSHAAR